MDTYTNNGNPVAMLPQADAIAYGISTALRRGFNGKAPRTRTIASECISIMPDGTRKVFNAPHKSRNKYRARIVRNTTTRSSVDIALMQGMGTIHD